MNKPVRKPPYQKRNAPRENNPPSAKKQEAWALLDTIFREDKGFQGSFAKNKAKHLHWDLERDGIQKQLWKAKGDYLAETILENPSSVLMVMLEAASIGLSWRPTLRQVYLTAESVAGRKTAVCSISYIGFEYLALKSGAVKQIQTELVFSGDHFRRGMHQDGTNWVEFEPARKDRGDLEGGFCRALMANGTMQVEHMDVSEIEGCAEAAAAMRNGTLPPTWSGPFRSEMEKKCVVRRAAKHWIIGENLNRALEIMDRNEPMDFDAAKQRAEAEAQAVANTVVDALTEQDILEILGQFTDVKPEKVRMWIKLQTEAWGFKELKDFPRQRKPDVLHALKVRHAKIKEMQAAKLRQSIGENDHAEHA